MADDAEEQVAEALGEAEGPDAQGGMGSRRWLIVIAAAVLLVGASGGLGTAWLFRGEGGPPPLQEGQVPQAPQRSGGKQDQFVYYDFEPITANLDESRLARYIRATMTLAFKPENFKLATETIEKRLPELRSRLTVYLSGCTLEDVRGPKNLNRIRREIQDSLNRDLWPGGNPLIEEVFFKEFVVQ